MYVHVDYRRGDEPKDLVLLRQKWMKVQGQRESQFKSVLSIRGPSLLCVLQFIHRYAAVDSYTLMPLLIMINVFTFTNTLSMFELV